MSYSGGDLEVDSTGTVLLISHGAGSGALGERSVLAVFLEPTTTITHIYERFTTTDAGFTLWAQYSAQGVKVWLYQKICGASEVSQQYEIHVSAAPFAYPMVACMADFATFGDPIAAYAFVNSGGGSANLTLPSVEATNGDDILAMVWSDPLVASGQLRPQSPLVSRGTASAFPAAYFEPSTEVWQSSSPTGTRQYAVPSGSYSRAIGVMMLVGSYLPIAEGGWGVGFIRMGAN